MGDLVMDEYHYTILYRREQLGTYKYLYLPCYVIKGLYDEKENIFLDELNKYRFLYNDFCSISDSTGYCVGEVYTEKELREKFPKANSLEDLEIKLIESQEFKTLIGCFDIMNHKVIFNTIDNTNEQKEYAILSSNGIANSKSKMAETTNEKMLSDDEDEYRVSYEELEEMLDADDIEEIKNILIDAINYSDFDTEESYLFFPEKLVNAFLNSNDIEQISIQSTRDTGFKFIVTEASAIKEIYSILSRAKVSENKSSLDPDYKFEFDLGDEIKEFNYVVGTEDGNFYNDDNVFSVSKRLDEVIIKNLSFIRKPRDFDYIYYQTILEVLQIVNKNQSLKDYNVGVNISGDIDCLKYVFSSDLNKFLAEAKKISPNIELVNNNEPNFDIVITVKNRGYDSSNFKTLITVNNKRESTENKYYVVAVNEFKEWNIDVLENKPSGW